MKISDRIRNVMALAGIGSAASKDLQAIADELDAAENPKWFWGRPDKPGHYRYGSDKPKQQSLITQYVDVSIITGWPEGWYAYISQIPEIEPPAKPKQYRTPKLPDDAGKVCEFSNVNSVSCVIDKLIGYTCNGHGRNWMSDGAVYYDNCRIEVTP